MSSPSKPITITIPADRVDAVIRALSSAWDNAEHFGLEIIEDDPKIRALWHADCEILGELHGMVHDAAKTPSWSSIVTAAEVRAYIDDSEYPDDANVSVSASEIGDEIIASAMSIYDRRNNFQSETPLSEIADIAAALYRERNDK